MLTDSVQYFGNCKKKRYWINISLEIVIKLNTCTFDDNNK